MLTGFTITDYEYLDSFRYEFAQKFNHVLVYNLFKKDTLHILNT
jgi:hypothetical protein